MVLEVRNFNVKALAVKHSHWILEQKVVSLLFQASRSLLPSVASSNVFEVNIVECVHFFSWSLLYSCTLSEIEPLRTLMLNLLKYTRKYSTSAYF